MILSGNSGASVCFNLNHEIPYVEKTCRGPAAERLKLQAAKQAKHQSCNCLVVPKILDIIESNNQTTIKMEYFSGLDFVSYTSKCSIEEFKKTVSVLSNYIKKNLLEGEIIDFPKEVWTSKFDEVIEKIEGKIDSRILAELKRFSRNFSNSKLTIGECHGDLTFSNVIVEKPEKVCLIDFLNPPIETPYEDLSKILQDSSFNWTLRRYTQQVDFNRVKIFWNWAEDYIMNDIGHLIDNESLIKIRVLSMLRILPYTTDSSMIRLIVEYTRCLIK